MNDKERMMRKAFTLIEINLAVLVMAGGILSVVVLYSLGYRETRQSREDIVSTAYSDAVLSPLVAALSDKNLEWKTFDNILGNSDLESLPEEAWGGFLNDDGTVRENDEAEAVCSRLGVSLNKPGNYKTGLVVFHKKGSGIVKLGFRTSKRIDDLLTAPLYYTEVRFQGGFKENAK